MVLRTRRGFSLSLSQKILTRNDKAARRLPPVGSFLKIVKESGGSPYYGGGPT